MRVGREAISLTASREERLKTAAYLWYKTVAGRVPSSLLTFVAEQASKAESHGRLPDSSEVLESVIGKYKALQGESGHSGVTGMLLSVAPR